MRGDMIQVYKMIRGRYDETVKRVLRPMIENIHNTRGNSKRLHHPPVKTERRKPLFLHTRNNSMELSSRRSSLGTDIKYIQE